MTQYVHIPYVISQIVQIGYLYNRKSISLLRASPAHTKLRRQPNFCGWDYSSKAEFCRSRWVATIFDQSTSPKARSPSGDDRRDSRLPRWLFQVAVKSIRFLDFVFVYYCNATTNPLFLTRFLVHSYNLGAFKWSARKYAANSTAMVIMSSIQVFKNHFSFLVSNQNFNEIGQCVPEIEQIEFQVACMTTPFKTV